MNILLCSAGRRVKLVQYFKEELEKIGGKVVAVDCDSTAPALQFADHSEKVPPITDTYYIKAIKQVCQKYNIQAVLSLIDPELSLLAEYIDEFEKMHIKVICSKNDVINICFDKYLTYKFLQNNGIQGIPTYLQLKEVFEEIENGQIRYPLIVKPRRGSASFDISKINSYEELNTIWKDSEDLVIQPFIDTAEYGVDCFVDLLNNQMTNIFCKRKIKMRAGETDKSIAEYDPILIQLIESLIDQLKPIGPIDIDCFKTEQGYLISEINPRFGGGYPHAHEMGQNFVKNIINNLNGNQNKRSIGKYQVGTIMVKFDEVSIIY
ncbi:ATP-grasp domain-containing protein [Heyndrickxia oleronia]|uniref:ATP-grasp domain-containing protein n=1 Tax=Heyndrickxia oleronia TaxID=38875 RepID=UPI002431AA59|nr:ATP-grasp domain-containing protein [Heyndrickxia oleronia]MCI1590693.1 ATP-grasp domain-containing protein [Heyndrickxia oleronia]MCI1612118.1 ATP-grasp domain-containing protein [Heyndrickxia oleronia]MCI1759827.1 ATP-grasp domain-containing protein [Heyndrickxia oleronia]